jgi:streptogramin lyase
MWLNALRRWVDRNRGKSRGRVTPRRKVHVRPRVEALEDRILLTNPPAIFLSPNTGNTIQEFNLGNSSAGLAGASVSADGSFWFSEYHEGFQIAKISPSGVVTTFNYYGGAPIIDPQGNVWFSGGSVPIPSNGHAVGITEMKQDGTLINYFAPSGPNNKPEDFGLAFDPLDVTQGAAAGTYGASGHIWFIDPYEADVIGRLNDDGTASFFNLAMPDNYGAANLIVDPKTGNLWFSATSINVIGEVDLSALNLANPNAPTVAINYYDTPYNSPRGLTYGPDGNIWATEASNGYSNAIIQLNPAEAQNQTAQDPYAGVAVFTAGLSANSGAYGMTVGPDGALWFTEENTNNIGRITTGGAITEYAIPTAGAVANGVAASADAIWFSEYGAGKIGKMELTDALPVAQMGNSYAETISATGGTAPYSYSVTSGQTITLPAGNYQSLSFLGLAVNGNQPNQTFTVNYSDGSSQTFTQSISDWSASQTYGGEQVALPMNYLDTSDGSQDSGTFNIYGYSFTLDATKSVESITLPNNSNVDVLAMDLTDTSNVTTSVPLSSLYNTVGIVNDASTFSNGLDGSHALSATLVGSTLTWNGASYTLGLPGGNDVVSAGVSGNAALPPGLTLSGGTIGDTPTAPGLYRFTVTATDSSTGTGPFSASQTYTLDIPTPIVVTTTDDTGTASGVSLRQAIEQADSSPGGAIITFAIPTTDPGYDSAHNLYKITLQSALPALTNYTQILGPVTEVGQQGATAPLTIDGANQFQVFNVDSQAPVLISGLTIADGSATDGGVIYNSGNLTVSHCNLSGNVASDMGGAIFNAGSGSLTVLDSSFSGNSALGSTGGGGAIMNDSSAAPMFVTGCTFTNNTVTWNGGAILTDPGGVQGTATYITGSTFTLNQSGHDGGTIANGGPGTLYVSDSTISGGQGPFNGGIYNSGTLAVSNSTFTGNTGGSYGSVIETWTNATIVSSTISGNQANGSGGIWNAGSLALVNSIVAGNTNLGSGTPDDISGGFNDQGYNLLGTALQTGNLPSTDLFSDTPGLAPLATNNNGATQTMALLPSSFAIGHGDPNLVGSIDQNGISRNQTQGDDIGAFESQGLLPVPLAPAGLSATLVGTQVSLTWQISAYANDYLIYRATSSAGPYSLLTTTTSTSYMDAPTSIGTYYYKVAAANASGASGPITRPVTVALNFVSDLNLQLTDTNTSTTQSVLTTDNFDANQNYVTDVSNGYSSGPIAGTIWDGILNPGSLAAGDANITSPDTLTWGNTVDTGWENGLDNGPVPYVNVTGNFDVSVEVTSMTSVPYSDGGIIVRDPNSSVGNGTEAPATGENENYVGIRHFAAGGFDASRGTVNNVTDYRNYSNFDPWLRIARTGTTFNLYTRPDAQSPWVLQDTIDRPDIGSQVQVGLWFGTFLSGLTGQVQFQHFSLTTQPAGVGPGDTVSLGGTFKDTLPGPENIVVNWGDGTTTSGSASGSIPASVLSHVYSNSGAYPVQVTISDGSLVTATAAFVLPVGTVNPLTASVGGSSGTYTIQEGGSLTLDASGSFDPVYATQTALNLPATPPTYSWTINGAANAATGVNPALSWSDLQNAGISEEGSYSISVTVDDGYGDAATASGTLTVSDAPLLAGTVTLPNVVVGEVFGEPQAPPAGLIAGEAGLPVAYFTDENAAATASDFGTGGFIIIGGGLGFGGGGGFGGGFGPSGSVSINWGDGTTSNGKVIADPYNPGGFFVYQATGGFSSSPHEYQTPGLKTITTTITDAGGSTLTVQTNVMVDALTAPDLQTDIAAQSSASAVTIQAFNSTGGAAAAKNYSALPTNTADNNPILVLQIDTQAEANVLMSLFSTANLSAWNGVPAFDPVASIGSGVSLNAAQLSIPQNFTLTISGGTWISGTGAPALELDSGNLGVVNSTFVNDSSAATVLVNGGGLVLGSDNILQSTDLTDNPALIDVASGAIIDLSSLGGNTLTGAEGNPIYVTGLSLDPGTTPNGGTVTSNSYTPGQNFEGGDGLTAQGGTISLNVQVNDAPLTAAAASPITTTQEAVNNVVLATFTDANSYDQSTSYSANISWGDSNSTTGTIMAETDGNGNQIYENGAPVFEVLGSYTYQTDGNFPVTVTIADVDGSTATATTSITVVPVASASAPSAILQGTSLTLDGSASTDPAGLPLTYTWTVNGTALAASSSPTITLSWPQLQTDGVTPDIPFSVSLVVADANATSAPTSATTTVQDMTSTNLQAALAATNTLSFSIPDSGLANQFLTAVDSLDPATTGTINVDLNGQTIHDAVLSPPSGTTANVTNGNFVGGSPALIVGSGTVNVTDSTFSNSTNAATILVTGGSLILGHDTIQQSTDVADNPPLIDVESGTIDLTSEGGNTIVAQGTPKVVGAGVAAQVDSQNILTVTDASGTYNGSPFQATATATVGGAITLTYYAGNPVTGTALSGAPTAPGTYSVVASFAGNGNYTPATASTTFTIAPAPLTVTVNSVSAIYGQPLPTLTGTIAGIQNGDPITATYSTLATPTSPVGSYPITVTLSDGGSGKLADYAVTIVPGTVTITQPAPGVMLVGSTLYIYGSYSGHSGDAILIGPAGTSTTGSTGVQVSGVFKGVVSSQTYNQPIAAIDIFGFNDNQAILESGALTVATYVHEGNGNNIIQLGGGTNVVTVGAGNNLIAAGNGTNQITAGNGNDSVLLGNGNNVVTVGNGNGDSVQVGNGNNVVVVGNGNGDFIWAGDGDNLLIAGLGRHTVRAGKGSNILIDGSVTTLNGATLTQILDEWILDGKAAASLIRTQMSVTDNTSHANSLTAGSGLDWFWYTYSKDSTNRKSTDLWN